MIVDCKFHGEIHKLPSKAIREILNRAQDGELNTIHGNTVCLYTLIGEDPEEQENEK